MKAWKAALAAAVATAAIALIVMLPMAASSTSKGLKITSEAGSGSTRATAKCPRGFVVIAGGFQTQEINVVLSQKLDERRWTVRALEAAKRGQLVEAQAICAKGTGGLRIDDLG